MKKWYLQSIHVHYPRLSRPNRNNFMSIYKISENLHDTISYYRWTESVGGLIDQWILTLENLYKPLAFD